MNAEMLRELQDRGRFFYQNFSGAAAADEWTRHRDRRDEKKSHIAKLASESDDEEAPPSLLTKQIKRHLPAPWCGHYPRGIR